MTGLAVSRQIRPGSAALAGLARAFPRWRTANGLDQLSGSQVDKAVFLDKALAEAAGLETHPVAPSGGIDKNANATLAGEVARQGITLLPNEGQVLPLVKSVKKILVIGGYADRGLLSGAGSSQEQGDSGHGAVVPQSSDGPIADKISEQYHASPPVKAIREIVPGAEVTYIDVRYVSEAVAKARAADAIIAFGAQWMKEGVGP